MTQRSNTSPVRNRRVYDKNNLSRGAFKRNLFGEPETQGSPFLAKKLIDSPQKGHTHPFLMDPAIRSYKCNRFDYQAEFSEREKKSMYP